VVLGKAGPGFAVVNPVYLLVLNVAGYRVSGIEIVGVPRSKLKTVGEEVRVVRRVVEKP